MDIKKYLMSTLLLGNYFFFLFVMFKRIYIYIFFFC